MNKFFPLQTTIIVCLTLGLAPFVPEPHIWGKLKWIAGGAVGMQAVDWFDTLMHGTPFIILIILILIKIKNKFLTQLADLNTQKPHNQHCIITNGTLHLF